MRNWICTIAIFGFGVLYAQKDGIAVYLEKYNKNTVPYMYANTLQKKIMHYVLLDAREEKEYLVSKIGNASFVGHRKFRFKNVVEVLPTNKKDTIVVYCSIGVRSEQVAEKLLKKGYTNVFNLYGGIFHWKNQGKTVLDTANMPTNKVHAYDKVWGKLLRKGEKIYE
ncbi:MAG: rhodanese-like domain-containing protein [Flavobacteriaceae bacterium]|nr:rhodanese-like domain-containing protein [Flavobacteriaceae bacterium]